MSGALDTTSTPSSSTSCCFKFTGYQSKIENRNSKMLSHSHYLVAAIDVDHLPGNRPGSIAREENPHRAQLGRLAAPLQRRVLLIMLQHRAEPADSARGKRVHRSRRNAIHPDFPGPKIVSEITSRGFEARFRHAHDVVMRHHFLGAVIGHRHDAAAV